MSLNRMMVIIVGVLCIAALAIVAVANNGIDGAVLTAGFAIIGRLVGWQGARIADKVLEKKK